MTDVGPQIEGRETAVQGTCSAPIKISRCQCLFSFGSKSICLDLKIAAFCLPCPSGPISSCCLYLIAVAHLLEHFLSCLTLQGMWPGKRPVVPFCQFLLQLYFIRVRSKCDYSKCSYWYIFFILRLDYLIWQLLKCVARSDGKHFVEGMRFVLEGANEIINI